MGSKRAEKIGVLVHIYDFLNGGYFAAHHQLRFYSQKVYALYLENNVAKLAEIYQKEKRGVPVEIVEIIEKSAGIRYFLCDDCHDARVENIELKTKDEKSSLLTFHLNTDGMLGCLALRDEKCKVVLEVPKEDGVLDSFFADERIKCGRLYWIDSEIDFDDCDIYFTLALQVLNGNGYEDVKYRFKLKDILIEGQ